MDSLVTVDEGDTMHAPARSLDGRISHLEGTVTGITNRMEQGFGHVDERANGLRREITLQNQALATQLESLADDLKELRTWKITAIEKICGTASGISERLIEAFQSISEKLIGAMNAKTVVAFAILASVVSGTSLLLSESGVRIVNNDGNESASDP